MHARRLVVLGLFILVVFSNTSSANDSPANTGQWLKPFNGKDLSGWDGVPGLWRVENGVLIGETTPEKTIKHHTYLIWKDGIVADFELRLQFKVTGKRANSGVQYRSEDLGDHLVAGYQCNLMANRPTATAVLEEMKRGRGGHLAELGQQVIFHHDGRRQVVMDDKKLADTIAHSFKKNDWNELVIRAQGHRLQHWLNGHLAIDTVDNDAKRSAARGILAFQLHTGPSMKLELKQIQLQMLSARKKE